MSKKLLVVFGATGQQGGSVIGYVLRDPELSNTYSIRALTRDPASAASRNLASAGVEVIQCDNDSKDSLSKALEGAHTVFSMTSTIYHKGSAGKDEEISLGKSIADAAVAAKAHYLIWSSMVSPTRISGGKFPNVDHFESKYDVEQYIRTLPIKSAFFVPGSFMQNFARPNTITALGDGTYALFNIHASELKMPYIDIAADTGKWVGAILAEREKYEGKGICAATRLYTQAETAELISKATGKMVKHVRIPVERFEGYLPEGFRTQLSEMTQYMQFGYYGKDMEKDVAWGAAQARGKLTELGEYFAENPLKYE